MTLHIKRTAIIVGIILAVIAFVVVGRAARNRWLFRAPITGDFELVQRPFEHAYDIRWKSRVVVQDIFGWIVAKNLLLGSHSSNRYFAVDHESGTAEFFDDLGSFNAFLLKHDLKRYDMSDEENVSHLKYGAGRNRKYH